MILGFWCLGERLGAQDGTGQIVEPKSAGATKAKLIVLNELQQLRQDSMAKEKKILTDYTTQLDDARKTALQQGDLDEAQRILVLKRAVENDEVPFLPLSTNRLEIYYAQWHAADTVKDVTGLIRKLVRNDKCSLTQKFTVYGLTDIRPGVVKTLTVVYRYKGKMAIAQTVEGVNGAMNFVFP